jgi:hypothetical protein
MIAQHLVGHEIEYVFKMRYLSNTLRLWLMPKVCWDAGYRPLVEAAAAKDRWISPGGVEAITRPSVPDSEAENHGAKLFDGELQMVRVPNPEIPRGSTALVVIDNTI